MFQIWLKVGCKLLLLLLLLSRFSRAQLCEIPGSPVPGILQARTLERVAISLQSCPTLQSYAL